MIKFQNIPGNYISLNILLMAYLLIIATSCSSTNNIHDQTHGLRPDVLAKVNDVEITLIDFQKALNRLPARAKDRVNSNGYRWFLNEVIKRELLFQEAKKRGLYDNKEYIDKVNAYQGQLDTKGDVTFFNMREFKINILVRILLKMEIEDKADKYFEELDNRTEIGLSEDEDINKMLLSGKRDELFHAFVNDLIRSSIILINTQILEALPEPEQAMKKKV